MNLTLDIFITLLCVAFALAAYCATVDAIAKLYESRPSMPRFMWGFFGLVMAETLAGALAVFIAIGAWVT